MASLLIIMTGFIFMGLVILTCTLIISRSIDQRTQLEREHHKANIASANALKRIVALYEWHLQTVFPTHIKATKPEQKNGDGKTK